MATELFEQQHERIRKAYAAGLGADPSALTSGKLTIVDRPESHWGYDAFGTTFAAGSVMAVAPDLRDFVAQLTIEEHREATGPDYLANIRDEARRLGRTPDAYGPSIGWGLSSVPAAPALPVGVEAQAVDAERLNETIKLGTFPNGAGPADGSSGRSFRNKYGVALRDASGQTIALAGVFNTYELHEIGVDVAPEWQGRGIGVAVVALAVRAILDQGAVPFYGCGPTNIRSQRTALAVGFLPVCTDGNVA